MSNKCLISLFLLFFCIAIGCLNIGNVVAQSFNHLYATDVMFENPGVGSGLLVMGKTLRNGLQTITIPDGTGTIDTSYNNYAQLFTAMKALDAAHGSHSGINWQSFGY